MLGRRDEKSVKAENSHRADENEGFGSRGVISGTKYNHVGSRKEGLSSILDKKIIESNLRQKQNAFGGGGYTFQILGADGKTADPNATLNIGGRVFKANANGQFRIVDQDYLDMIEKEHHERREYVNGIVKKCFIDDDIACGILGIEYTTLQKLCGPGTLGAEAKDWGMSAALAEYDCTPSFVCTLDENSSLFSGAISKMAKIVERLLPITEHMTSAKTANETIVA